MSKENNSHHLHRIDGYSSAMIAMSGIMKLAGAQQMVQALSKIGLANYVTLLGAVELTSLVLF